MDFLNVLVSKWTPILLREQHFRGNGWTLEVNSMKLPRFITVINHNRIDRLGYKQWYSYSVISVIM
jgi:hypothetical protein